MAEILVFRPPIAVKSEPSSGGQVTIAMHDADGLGLFGNTVDTALAESEYARLDRLRSRLERARPLLERALKGRSWGGAPRPVDWTFDGCEGSAGVDLDFIWGPVGCFSVIIVLLFFVLPTVAIILLALGLLFAAFVALVGVGQVFLNVADQWRCYLRVVRASEVRIVGYNEGSGLGFLRSHPKFVVFAQADNVLVVASADASPARAIRCVAREALRQRSAIRERNRLDTQENAASKAAADRLAEREARRTKPQG